MSDNEQTFRGELMVLLNKYGKENGSSTPDVILADYITDALDAYDRAVRRRERWLRYPAPSTRSQEAQS